MQYLLEAILQSCEKLIKLLSEHVYGNAATLKCVLCFSGGADTRGPTSHWIQRPEPVQLWEQSKSIFIQTRIFFIANVPQFRPTNAMWKETSC